MHLCKGGFLLQWHTLLGLKSTWVMHLRKADCQPQLHTFVRASTNQSCAPWWGQVPTRVTHLGEGKYQPELRTLVRASTNQSYAPLWGQVPTRVTHLGEGKYQPELRTFVRVDAHHHLVTLVCGCKPFPNLVCVICMLLAILWLLCT